MYRQLLVAYDGSEPADGAFDLAAHLAAHLAARLSVAHVVEPQAAPAEERERHWHKQLDQLARRVAPNVAVESQVLVGPIAERLLDYTDQIGADLVVAGTHGVGHIKQALFGSVSHRLLRHASCDLLFLRRPLSLERSPSLLVGFDGSAGADRALTVGDELARALDSTLILTHVAPLPPFGGSVYLSAETRADIRRQVGRRGHELLERARTTIASDRVLEDRREGYVRPELLAACAQHAPVIAVVGTRGTEGFPGLLVGSATRDLLDYSDNPVLVVRAEAESA